MRPDGGDPVRSHAAALGAVLALSVATLTQVPAGSAAAPRTGGLRVARGPDGYARFVAPTGSTRDPGIGVATPAVTAARTHLERYGAVLGLGRSRLLGGRLTRRSPATTWSASGNAGAGSLWSAAPSRSTSDPTASSAR